VQGSTPLPTCAPPLCRRRWDAVWLLACSHWVVA
jgi:hypothetical protein